MGRPLKSITPYIKNAKLHPKKQVEKVAASIKEFGFNQPIVIDKQGVIIVGHGRFEAAKLLGMTDVPVIEVDLTEEQAKAYRLADNKLNESEWDMKLAVDELKELSEEMQGLTGFDLDLLIEPDEKDDEIPENVPPVAQLGDLYQLGNHRVLCGDSTKIEDVERLMDGKKADMVFTDPPYQIETEGGCKGEIGKSLKKQGSDINFISDFNPEEFLNILPTVFEKGKINAYIFCNKELLPEYLIWAKSTGYSFNVLVWKKPNAIPIGDSHRPDIEYLLLFRKSAIWNNGINGVNYSRCLEYGREKRLHPTMKPIELLTNEIKISSNNGSIVLDPFLGSGSTLIAAEKTGRICYGMELDPKYVDVIVKRWEDYTGLKAVKVE